jgi:glycosyltransferase involved in cell wall biosynthesis
MKVGLVLASSARAGAELFVVSLAKALRAGGEDVTVILLQQGDVSSLLEDVGVRVIQLQMHSKRSLGVLLQLARHFALERFDIIHAHGARAAAYASCAALFSPRSARLATVHQLIDATASGEKERIENLLYRQIFDQVIGVSVCCCEDVISGRGVHPEKVALIYNGIEVLPQRSRPRSGRVIGALGRLSPVKGFGRLVRAFHRLAETDSRCRLVLGGEGPERVHLESLAAAGCGHARIEFAGLVTDTVGFLDRIDILAIPSRSESFGLVAVEAMSQGVPILAADVGGLREILEQGRFGNLVRDETVPAFAEALRELLNDVGRRAHLAEVGPVRARDFSIQHCASLHQAVYRSVKGEKH